VVWAGLDSELAKLLIIIRSSTALHSVASHKRRTSSSSVHCQTGD